MTPISQCAHLWLPSREEIYCAVLWEMTPSLQTFKIPMLSQADL